jgi:hypothetical protein
LLPLLSSRLFGTYRLKARVPCHIYPFEASATDVAIADDRDLQNK